MCECANIVLAVGVVYYIAGSWVNRKYSNEYLAISAFCLGVGAGLKIMANS